MYIRLLLGEDKGLMVLFRSDYKQHNLKDEMYVQNMAGIAAPKRCLTFGLKRSKIKVKIEVCLPRQI